VLAITGTNGKTTTTALTGHLLRATGKTVGVAGNISPAALTALMDAQDAGALPQVWVLELSSFQLETTETLFLRRPRCSTFPTTTSIATSTSMNTPRPRRGFSRAQPVRLASRCSIANDTRVCRMVLPDRSIISFGLDAPAAEDDFGLRQNRGEPWLVQGDRFLLPVSELPLAGLHNAANAMAALALCSSLGFDANALLPALRSFRGLPHRVEKIAELDGVSWYDDSKGTNVGATVAALNGIGGQLAAQKSRLPSSGREVGRDGASLLGLRSEGSKDRGDSWGDGKGQDFSPLRKAVARHARAAVLIGRDGPLIEKVIGAAANVTIESARDMDDAVSRARALAQPGRCRAAVAGLRQLRHVPQLRASSTGLHSCGAGPGGAEHEQGLCGGRAAMPRPSSTACCCGRRSACCCSGW
jgi:UDP-N-acetylmuramoylalanine--D-glutamate ligase